ncbi:helix-turn-helix transcriptional regulator [Ruegeria sp. ANG-S4]|uniref:helix-turn-helix transcriptional regulator n=1 Tax=Ruegeria sp. ANG-S4 TaxID=1577904 RepID=UPI00068E119C|nr:LuxR family transcriptional regulator [Ruegeria sp. ANG-S4]
MNRLTFIDRERSNRLLDFSEKLTNAATVDLAWSHYSDALAQLGAKSAVYGFFPKTVGRSIASEVVAMSSHSEEFNRLYLDEGYIDHDPFAQYALTEDQRPISWRDPRAKKFQTKKSDFFQNSMKDFGMDYGITIPVRDASNWKLGGTGVCFEACSEQQGDEIVARATPFVESAAMLFHSRVQEGDMMRQFFPLSTREKECLLWVAAGLTNKEIAFKLSLSDKTVELHVKNAAKRLNARNRAHAVSRALIYGVIAP